MTEERFIKSAKQIVKNYAIAHSDSSDRYPVFKVNVVSSFYILGIRKALISTTLINDMYYEITYDEKTNEVYFDAYSCEKNELERRAWFHYFSLRKGINYGSLEAD